METYQNVIGGEWFSGSGSAAIVTHNPATGEEIGQVMPASAGEVDRAVETAREAFERSSWGHDPRLRARVLLRYSTRIEADKERLARLLTTENGKKIREARLEIAGAADLAQYYGGLARNVWGRSAEVAPDSYGVLLREPIGVVGIIVPWNWPAQLLLRSLAPALAAGCSVVIKPPSLTPGICVELVKLLLADPELPKGIVNLVTGSGESIGAQLTQHSDVDMISFTGDTVTGRKLMEYAAGNLKKLSLELGGKSPNVVFADVNLEKAIPATVNAIFISSGQLCMAGSRLVIEERIKDEFLAKLRPAVEALKVGNGLEESTDVGPVVSELQLKRVLQYIEVGKGEGQIVTGGRRLTEDGFGKGNFVAPTIIAGVAPTARVVKEEIFGPVLVVQSFRDEEEAIALANGTEYGLAGAVWTENVNRAMRVGRRIKSGTVWINTYNKMPAECEFGGYKASGIGRTKGLEGLYEFTELKHLFIDTNPTYV